jgi:putative membrane protein
MSKESPGSVDPRTGLAHQRTDMASLRTALALDRTALAWVRTTLTMASFGFGMVAFFRSLRQASPNPETVRLHQGAIFFGVALIVLALLATMLAALSQWSSLRRLRRGETPRVSPWPLSITVAMLVAVLFLVGLWSLFAR